MNTAPRLGYLVPQFPGQTHVFFWREIQALRALGVDPVLLSTRLPANTLISHEWSSEAMAATTYLGKGISFAGASSLMRLPVSKLLDELRGEPASIVRDVALALPMAVRLIDVARREKLQHVHAHSLGRAALIAALARLMGGPSYSITLHGPVADYGTGQRLKWGNAAFATIITRQLLAEARALDLPLPESVVVQPMGVDVDFLSRDMPWTPPLVGEPIRLFSCARLNPVKGHLETVAAVKMLLERGRAVSLTIAGEDDDGGAGFRKVLEARIAELGVGEAVTLLGAIDGAEVKRRLLESHFFVLASHHEPLGVALMEAMSCEVPVISTAAGGVGELITHGHDGVLVGPKDPVAITEAIIDLADRPAFAAALGRTGRQTIVERFSATLGAETLIREMVSLAR
jgi:glycosyltransferase involved in cell wall biosynthesis